jgi:hypothetical protein
MVGMPVITLGWLEFPCYLTKAGRPLIPVDGWNALEGEADDGWNAPDT